MSFTPSTYQVAIFDWIREGRGDGAVKAVAGGGKTSTLVMAAGLLSSSNGLFCAFNKHIAEELNSKLKGTGMQAKTIHSIGNGMLYRELGRPRIDNRKYGNLAKAYVERYGDALPWEELYPVRTAIKELADMARLTLTDPCDGMGIRKMCQHYDIVIPDPIALTALPKVLEQGERIAQMGKTIDFTDMIYLPVKWNLKAKPFEWVFVDECQDLNAAQLELLLGLRAPGGRYLFVGDPNQAIMGFAGADNNSFYNIVDRTNATVLPLSVCYRCPTSHIKEAQSLVPEMKPVPGAKEGTIKHILRNGFEKHVQEGDLILCRLTAPLIEACISLIKKKIPARVRGRDIGKGLISMLEKVATLTGFTYEEVGRYLNKYKELQTSILIDREADESVIQSLHDRIECLEVCVANYPEAKNIEQLSYHIKQLFDDGRASVWLSTVHRAKGLENHRVMILKPHKLPLVWPAQMKWQRDQEDNLLYVAQTRSTDTLIYVHDKRLPDSEEAEIIEEVEIIEEPQFDFVSWQNQFREISSLLNSLFDALPDTIGDAQQRDFKLALNSYTQYVLRETS